MAPPKRQRRSQALDNLGSPPDGYLLTGDPDADEGMAWSNDVTTALAVDDVAADRPVGGGVAVQAGIQRVGAGRGPGGGVTLPLSPTRGFDVAGG